MRNQVLIVEDGNKLGQKLTDMGLDIVQMRPDADSIMHIMESQEWGCLAINMESLSEMQSMEIGIPVAIKAEFSGMPVAYLTSCQERLDYAGVLDFKAFSPQDPKLADELKALVEQEQKKLFDVKVDFIRRKTFGPSIMDFIEDVPPIGLFENPFADPSYNPMHNFLNRISGRDAHTGSRPPMGKSEVQGKDGFEPLGDIIDRIMSGNYEIGESILLFGDFDADISWLHHGFEEPTKISWVDDAKGLRSAFSHDSPNRAVLLITFLGYLGL